MYSIEFDDYGLRLTFRGSMTTEEMEAWYRASEEILDLYDGPLSVIMDRRELGAISDEAVAFVFEGHKMYNRHGFERAAIVTVPNDPLLPHSEAAAEQGGTRHKIRYIDGNAPDWEEQARRWVVEGAEPRPPAQSPETIRELSASCMQMHDRIQRALADPGVPADVFEAHVEGYAQALRQLKTLHGAQAEAP